MDITSWFHIITDLIISISSIFAAVYIIRFIKNKPKLPVKGAFWFFAFFVFFSGLVYLSDFVQTWIPLKDAAVILRLITAFASIVGLVLITRFFPVAIALKSPVEYQDLEHLVTERTKDLEHALKNEKAAIHELKRNQMRLEFLKDASEVLSSTLNYCEVMERLTRTLTPRIADWCTIYEYGEDGSLKLVIVSHSNPDLYPVAVEISQKYPPNPDYPDGVYKVIESQKPVLNKRIPEDMIVRNARDPEHLRLLKLLEIRSSILVPLYIRDKMFGVLMLVWSDPNKQYDEQDLEFAKEIGRQTMLAVENARLYEESQKVNALLEMRVSKRTQELQRMNKELEAFSYSVSHDLRAPLRSIDGFSNKILKDYGAAFDEQGRDYFHRIQRASQHMGHLIDDMLKLSRLSRVEIHPEYIDLSSLAEGIIHEIKSSDPERNVEVKIRKDMIVRADHNLMQIALQNLMDNAWKYTRKKSDAVIEFSSFRKDHKIVYFIKDNGAGFDMKYADKLFGTFQRLHNASEFEGTGIGLATVQRIILRHHGSIWAEAEAGQGAVFYFTL